MKQFNRELLTVEEDFYSLDHDKKTAGFQMAFEKPDDILDSSVVTKTPKMTSEFMDQLLEAFDDVPDEYHLDILVTFEDLGGYTEEQLSEICRKNVLLNARRIFRLAHRDNRLALLLCGIGLFFMSLFTLIDNVWAAEGTAKDVIMYILDIAATVPFWGAMEIYFIDSSERRKRIRNIRKRYHSIEFRQKKA